MVDSHCWIPVNLDTGEVIENVTLVDDETGEFEFMVIGDDGLPIDDGDGYLIGKGTANIKLLTEEEAENAGFVFQFGEGRRPGGWRRRE
jgi:hypothetical protein